MNKTVVLRTLLAGLFIASLLGFRVAEANDEPKMIYEAELVRIIDADTMEVELNMGLGVEFKATLRIQDYDAPETWRPRNEAEERHGIEATKYATELLQEPFRVHSYGWVVYNRVEARLEFSDGSFFSDKMVEAGYEKRDYY